MSNCIDLTFPRRILFAVKRKWVYSTLNDAYREYTTKCMLKINVDSFFFFSFFYIFLSREPRAVVTTKFKHKLKLQSKGKYKLTCGQNGNTQKALYKYRNVFETGIWLVELLLLLDTIYIHVHTSKRIIIIMKQKKQY